jgi:oxygen-independent coproporphyrinogen-3 oxidase
MSPPVPPGPWVYGFSPSPRLPWDEAQPQEDPRALSLYVHIPYCARRCAFCDLSVGRPRSVQEPLAYLTAVRREIVRAAQEEPSLAGRPAVTAYFGGGTPTSLPPEGLAGVLWLLRDAFGLDEKAECTVEADPATVDQDRLWALRRAGFDRISFGVQSLSDRVLRRLGRLHDAQGARQAVRWAVQEGFAHISIDLILGLPGVDRAMWRATVQEVAGWPIDHVSVYALEVEMGTAFGRLKAAGHLRLPPEDLVVEMGDEAQDILEGAGFSRYEISSYARPGGRCLHNEGYWTGRAYRGFGAGAHSYVDGQRFWNVRSPQRYLAAVVAGRSPTAGRERLEGLRALAEAVILALRRDQGVDGEAFARALGIDPGQAFAATWEKLGEAGLVTRRQGRLVLTRRGQWLYNAVAREILSAADPPPPSPRRALS